MNTYQTISAWVAAGEGEKLDLNCAESILYGANAAYGLGLDRSFLRVASGFGGGMGLEKHCGALTGSVMVLGLLFTRDRGHESSFVEDLNRELTARFEKVMGNTDCAPLKRDHRDDSFGCRKVILAAAEILDEIIRREMSR